MMTGAMMRRRVLTLFLPLLFVVFASCEASGPGGLRGVVLILLDTVRPDHLSAYGYDRETSPAISRLGERGVVFEQAVSSAPWTLPAAATLFSGSPAHRVFDERLTRSGVEAFQRAGFTTAAFTEGAFLSSRYGFSLGFQHYGEEKGFEAVYGTGTEPAIEKTFRLAGEWLARHRRDRFFLLIHTYEPHAPYKRRTFAEALPPGAVGETFEAPTLHALRQGSLSLDDADLEYLKALYDGGILETDRHVGIFLERLAALGIRDTTLVVLTSDHGEELGDHYRTRCGDHGHSLLDDLLKVPLIIDDPSRSYAASRVEAQVRTMDIMPTLLDLVGVPSHIPMEGRSLVPLMQGQSEPGRIAFGGSPHSGPDRSYVRHRGYKYVRVTGAGTRRTMKLIPTPPSEQLYELRKDPGELHNLVDEEPELVAGFRKLLDDLSDGDLRSIEAPDALDDELRKRLESLGYVD